MRLAQLQGAAARHLLTCEMEGHRQRAVASGQWRQWLTANR
jgi:hypothetical protein